MDEKDIEKTPLAKIWNQNRKALPLIKKLTPKRKKRSVAIWKSRPDPDYWKKQIQEFADHPHNLGDNERGWIANFDFFLREDIQIRIEEGYYQKKQKNNGATSDFIKKLAEESL